MFMFGSERSRRRSAQVVVVFAALLMSCLVALASPAQAATHRSISFTASPAELVGPGTVTLSGTVSSTPKGSTVYIERYSSKKWTGLKTMKTSSSEGAFTYSYTSSTYGIASYRARVAASGSRSAAVSSTKKVAVYQQTTATLTTSASEVTTPSSVTLSGKVSPFKAGTTVTLQRKIGEAWQTDGATNTVSDAGGYSFDRTPMAGVSQYRTVVAKTTTYLAQAVSTPVSIDATETGTTGDGGSPGTIDGQPIKQVSAGLWNTCALTTSGATYCWGRNEEGELGNDSTTDSSVPVPVNGLSSDVATISTGRVHTCAVTTGGAAYCWGDNYYGELGNGSTTASSVPVPVKGLSSGVATISAGGGHTCAVTTSGATYCWGRNGDGELGNATTTDSSVPVAVNGLSSGVATISAGDFHTCAVTTSGAAYCWGDDYYGGLGDHNHSDSSVPVPVSGLSSGVATISSGHEYTCAVTISGGAYCWGANFFGGIGNGTLDDYSVPVPVRGLSSGVATISAGEVHTCAVTVSGATYCWGYNHSGELGNGNLTDSHFPVPVSGLPSGFATISAGSEHTCAVSTSGGTYCWGYNFRGSLGNGDTTDSNVPVPVGR